MKDQYKKAVFSLMFTQHFLNYIKKVEQKKGKTLHTNGVPNHYIAVLQIILILKDNEMSTESISYHFNNILGKGINQSSLSRTLTYLHETLNLIKYTDKINLFFIKVAKTPIVAAPMTSPPDANDL